MTNNFVDLRIIPTTWTKHIVACFTSLVTLLLFLGCTAQTNSAAVGDHSHRNGKADAQKDIEAGHLYLKAYGLPHPATEQYAALLQKDLNVTYQQVGGCMVDQTLTKYANDYNEVILAYIAKKHGPNAIMDIWNKAKDEYDAKVKASGG